MERGDIPGVAVLTERVQNLINRVDIGFTGLELTVNEVKRDYQTQTRELKSELSALSDKVNNLATMTKELREEFNEHIITDTEVYKKVGDHLNAAVVEEAEKKGEARGKQQVLSFTDKLLLRILSVGGTVYGLYEVYNKFH